MQRAAEFVRSRRFIGSAEDALNRNPSPLADPLLSNGGQSPRNKSIGRGLNTLEAGCVCLLRFRSGRVISVARPNHRPLPCQTRATQPTDHNAPCRLRRIRRHDRRGRQARSDTATGRRFCDPKPLPEGSWKPWADQRCGWCRTPAGSTPTTPRPAWQRRIGRRPKRPASPSLNSGRKGRVVSAVPPDFRSFGSGLI